MTAPLIDQNELDQQWLSEMDDAMKNGGGVQLPFNTATVWPRNGSRQFQQFAQQSPVSYFGGWNIDDERITELSEAGEFAIPLDKVSWQRMKMTADSGDYIVYETRALHLSIIGYRMSWLAKDGRSRVQNYDQNHTRSHVQYLAIVGMASEGKIVPACVATVSVKGKAQTEAMKTSIAAWRKAIDAHRRELNVGKLPLAAFWVTIGTSGDKPDFVTVGKDRNTKEVTPMRAIIPQGFTAENAAARFVGKETLRLGYDYLKQADEWLKAWKVAGVQSSDYQPAAAPKGDEFDPFMED
jgi:hypothetical protein